MKGDFTRSTFRPEKHYSGVRMQQGRVQLDADWNEQVDITTHHVETIAGDVIGECGAPMHAAGFALSDGPLPAIGAGRYYVDGILCENAAEVALNGQPDLPIAADLSELITPRADAVSAGRYIAYLDVWQRHITALEDDEIREVALGGPDTATRTKTVWQVKLLGPIRDLATCKDTPPLWQALLDRAGDGKLSARAEESATEEGPCVVPPGAGYRRLENQLYRVEVHQVDAATGAIRLLKWSRDNGAIVARWLDQEDNNLIVSSIGRDEALSFGPGQHVEVSDDRRELHGEAGILVRLSNAEGQVLILDDTDPNAAAVAKDDFPDEIGGRPNNPKARRWDGVRQDPATSAWFELEDGVQIRLEPGRYHVGDYWLIPARTAKADVEWPQDATGEPIPQPRAGIEHHYCKLAVLDRAAGGDFTVVQDCRELFPPVTELTTLLYVGGDGQEAPPGQPLPYPLRVRVVNGQAPVIGARVEFTKFVNGSPVEVQLAGTTGPDGIAEYAWTLGTSGPQEVAARLLDAGADPAPGQLLRFGAALSVASQGGGCCITVGKGGRYDSLDEALKDLLARGERDICLCLLAGDHVLSLSPIRQSPGEPDLHVKIVGAGMGSRVRLEGPILFEGVAAATLHDMAFLVTFEAEGEHGALAFDGCGQVSLTGFSIAGRSAPGDQTAGGALVSLANTASARLRDVRLEAWTAVTFEPLLNALQQVDARVLFQALRSAGEGGEEFRKAALEAGAEILRLNDAERNRLAGQIRGLARLAEFTDAEQLALQKMMAAVANPDRPAEDYAAIIADMRRATIKARPGAALVLGALPDVERGDLLAKAPLGMLDRDNFISIESSEIGGEIGLYGLPVTPPMFTERLPENFLAELQRLMKAGRFLLGDGSLPLGTLELRGNQMLRIGLGMRLVDAFANLFDINKVVGFYNELLLTDNVFEHFPVAVAALHCGLANNQFLTGRDRTVGVVFGQSAAYTGNRGEVSRLFNVTQFSGEAANVRIAIT